MSDVNRLSESAIAILILILIVTVGATVLQTIRGTQVATSVDTGVADSNNPITVVTTNNNVTFGIPSIYDSLNPTLSTFVAINATDGTIYTLGNYTITNSTIFAWVDYQAENTTVNWSFSVTFDLFNADFNTTTAGLSALITYSDFFQVIVVIIVFAIIIGLFAFFTLRGRGSSI